PALLTPGETLETLVWLMRTKQRPRRLLSKVSFYFNDLRYEWNQPADFSAEQLASAVASSGDRQYEFIASAAKRRADLAKTGDKLRLANIAVIIAIYMSTFENDV